MSTQSTRILKTTATAIETWARVMAGLLALVTIYLLVAPVTMELSPKLPAATSAAQRAPYVDGVNQCKALLVRAHRHPTTRNEDRAVVFCSAHIRTQHQADRLYAWVYNGHNQWALALIG